jgi:hypothetical protein
VTSTEDPDVAEAAAVAAAVAGGAADAEGAVGARPDKQAKRRRIHPRDLAAYLVASLADATSEDTEQSGAPSTPPAPPAPAPVDLAALESQIVALEAEKAKAVAEQQFLKAGDLLGEVNRLKEQRAAAAALVSEGGGATLEPPAAPPAAAAVEEGEAAEQPDASRRTVEVWTYME